MHGCFVTIRLIYHNVNISKIGSLTPGITSLNMEISVHI